MWVVLDRASRGWRGFTMTPSGLRLLQDLRHALLDPPARLRPTNDQPGEHRTCQSRRLTYPCARTSVRPFTPSLGRHP